MIYDITLLYIMVSHCLVDRASFAIGYAIVKDLFSYLFIYLFLKNV